MAMSFTCKNCKKDMRVTPLQYEQSPFCNSCYPSRLRKFIQSNNVSAKRDSFGFRQSQKKAMYFSQK